MLNRRIFYPALIAVLLIIGLFWGVYKGLSVPPKKVAIAADAQQKMPEFDVDEMIAGELKKLHPGYQSEITALEQKVTQSGSQSIQKAAALEQLALKWMDYKRPVVAAHYMSEAGFLDNSSKKLNFAAHLLGEALHEEKDPSKKQWMANVALKSLERVAETDPTNVNTKIEMASLYINGLEQPMEGIQKLLEVVKEDSVNLAANLVLGKMAVESNQLDKAIERGELILRHYPENWESMIFMAEAYNRLGNKDKAIQMLQQAKKHNKNTAFIADVDKYIELIKK